MRVAASRCIQNEQAGTRGGQALSGQGHAVGSDHPGTARAGSPVQSSCGCCQCCRSGVLCPRIVHVLVQVWDVENIGGGGMKIQSLQLNTLQSGQKLVFLEPGGAEVFATG